MIGLITTIAIGILAGFLAGKIMRGQGYGVLVDLLLGIGGSIVGFFVFGLLGLSASPIIGRIVVSTAGAVLLIYVARQLK
jgi:uncharacterized membrane protein YeaQ/YmgE (transglycosylase-associated protein family)